MIKWLGAAGGAELAVIGLLGAALIFGTGTHYGKKWEKDAEAARQLTQTQELGKKSAAVSLDVDEIADDLSTKLGNRMSGRDLANAEAIEQNAKAVGRLEGEADGYIRGFNDAEAKLKDTCYTDPAYLTDGLRNGAKGRYGAIFGSKEVAGQDAKAGSLLSGANNDAPNGPPH